MCGRLNTSDCIGVQNLMAMLGLPLWKQNSLSRRFVRATDKVAIIREVDGQRRVDEAIWWLLLEQTSDGYAPSKYTSFNTRSDKLNQPRTAGYQPFRQSRCVILAKGFGETEFVNKKPIHYYDFEAEQDQCLAFAGLYKQWLHPITGETLLSCSIVTLPPHPKLQHLHSKAMPLILPQYDDSIAHWLDTSVKEVEGFAHLMQPKIPQDLLAYPIDKPSSYQQIGDAIVIDRDVA